MSPKQQKQEFLADMAAVKGDTESLVPNGTYRTLSPMLLLHAKKLWTGGLVANQDQIVQELLRLDSRIDRQELLRFLQESTTSEAWEKERQRTLKKAYERMLEDRDKITEHIDYLYDRIFDTVRHQAESFLGTFSADNIPSSGELRKITAALKDLYHLQRQTRQLQDSQHHTHEHLHTTTDAFNEERSRLYKFLDNMQIVDVNDNNETLVPVPSKE